MKKLFLILVLLTVSTLANAGGGGGKSPPPSAPPPPPPPPAPQAPSDPNVSPAIAREKTRRAQQGGQGSTFLTDGAALSEDDLKKPTLGTTTLLGG